MEQINKNMMIAKNGEESPRLYRRIGKARYEIELHFNTASVDTVHDKLKRIIINDFINNKIT